MKAKILISLLLCMAVITVLGASPVFATEVTPAEDATVYLTVSNQGVLAADNDGEAMANREVTVKDVNSDGTLTVDEALVAAHTAYNSADGYSAPGGYVSKLWGIESYNTLFFVNNAGLTSGVSASTVANGDKFVASINADSTYYADWYTFFDTTEKTVSENEEFTLTLKGHLGMAYTAEDMTDTALGGLSVGTWNNGTFTALDGKTTDENGKVVLSFADAGTYYISADGTVKDTVFDWSQPPYDGSATVEADCPIIAPVCIVTVEEKEIPAMSDADALAVVYNEFASKNENNYKSSANTPLIFPLTYEGKTYTNVISYLKAWALKETGRELSVDYEVAKLTTAYGDWSSGSKVSYVPTAFDANGEITQNYYKDNLPYSQRITLTFSVGGETSDKITMFYAKAKSLERTPQEIVDFVAANLPFARIIGKNTSADAITQAVGETKNNATGALPTKDELYTNTTAKIAWALTNISGKADALKLASNKITVLRPNVDEDDAKFTLTATVSSAAGSNVTKTVNYDLTVPAFDAVIVPVQVTEGATLTLTDNYYKADVESKYIVKQDNAPEGYDLYLCYLHTSATDGKQTFKYVVKKENYITQSGSINVEAEAPSEPYVYSLAASSENDTKLGSLAITAPTVSGFTLDPNVTSYTVEVKGATQIKFSGDVYVEGASAKITSYYSSLNNANKGTLTTSGKSLATTCYLPDAVSESVIKITVTAPDGSIQEVKTREYTITVKKTAESGPMTALALTASSTGEGKKNNVNADGAAAEETLSPVFVSGGKEEAYYYTVNYFRDKVSVKPTASGATITVSGATVASGKNSDPIALEVGDNTIPIIVTKDGASTEYKVVVHRKAELRLTDITLDEGALGTTLAADGSEWTGSCNFVNSADTLHITWHTNVTEAVTVKVSYNGNAYTGVAGEAMELPTAGSDKIMMTVQLMREVGGVTEAQSYVIGCYRMAADSPSEVTSYLPAPGQFVNEESYYNPGKTLSGSGMVTLGAFGGNIVYKYDEPIANDPNNPYGIDFIVIGNCFTNGDGSTASGAAEPAAVMVSKDGFTWYELAGSEYYTASTRRNLTVTYTNGDTAFTAAADTPWADSEGESGVMPKNSYHNQPYYPNPAHYSAFQSGVGKNSTYTTETVSFGGTMIETGFYPFGYADSHSANAAGGNTAANPYVANHTTVYNGDGFDLAWAVDENGVPIKLDEISYIKVYNPVMNYGGSKGETSAEINTVLRAKASDAAVGVSDGLTALSVNGDTVALEVGKYVYDVDGKGASSLVIAPVANADANIYVSNQRVISGENSAPIAAVSKLRIIVQEGEKEPVIYILNLTNVATPETNADLSELVLTPGDVAKSPDTEGNISFSVANKVTSVRFTPVTANKRAEISLSDGKLNEAVSLTSGALSEALTLDVGENIFTLKVTSVDGETEKTYTVTVTRAKSSASTDISTIKVKFSMTGDKLHYDIDADEYTGSHTNPTWIRTTTVELPKGVTVKYLTEMMLNNAGLDYETDGIYISEINGLAEFDNGPNSGWMYRHNGYIAEEGYADRVLENGDVIKWFYSDDYTKETGYEGGWDEVNAVSAATSYTVKFDSNGGSSVKSQKVEKNDTVTKPDAPTKDGCIFDGWYTDKALTTAYDFNAKVKKNFTLYAKWTKQTVKMDFGDVGEDNWYYASVEYVFVNNLMQGTGDRFEPDAGMTRAMLVTVLYRLDGAKATDKASGFDDVPENEWYADAVAWAAENDIVVGINETEFAPNVNITREQLAAVIYRYAKFKGYDVAAKANLNAYDDADEISEYAYDAVAWAVESKLVSGTSVTTVSPRSAATRAQVAAILMRFCENVK